MQQDLRNNPKLYMFIEWTNDYNISKSVWRLTNVPYNLISIYEIK